MREKIRRRSASNRIEGRPGKTKTVSRPHLDDVDRHSGRALVRELVKVWGQRDGIAMVSMSIRI